MEGTSIYEKMKVDNTVFDHISLKRTSTELEEEKENKTNPKYVSLIDDNISLTRTSTELEDEKENKTNPKYVSLIDDHYDTIL